MIFNYFIFFIGSFVKLAIDIILPGSNDVNPFLRIDLLSFLPINLLRITIVVDNFEDSIRNRGNFAVLVKIP